MESAHYRFAFPVFFLCMKFSCLCVPTGSPYSISRVSSFFSFCLASEHVANIAAGFGRKFLLELHSNLVCKKWLNLVKWRAKTSREKPKGDRPHSIVFLASRLTSGQSGFCVLCISICSPSASIVLADAVLVSSSSFLCSPLTTDNTHERRPRNRPSWIGVCLDRSAA